MTEVLLEQSLEPSGGFEENAINAFDPTVD